MDDLKYLQGFGNYLCSEAVKGALPIGRNNPQKPAFGLYAEQLSGSAFTELPHQNQRSWLYKILPSVVHSSYRPTEFKAFLSSPIDHIASPEQLRWDGMPYPTSAKNFLEGIFTICSNGDVKNHTGIAIHLYAANQSMNDECFYNADGDMLIVPQEGSLHIRTEFGEIDLSPGEITVVQRGIKFAVYLKDKKVRGYLCENYGEHFQLPYRSVIGANGLANERDFLIPVASYQQKFQPYKVICKFQGGFWTTTLKHSPFDVVAWHGNYVPYKYDLSKFNTINTVSFDHPDPSIFTVLTSPTSKPGLANIDFVIFPERWMVAEDTFRPPYYHRNVMSEYMGLIYGVYDAKPKAGGFVPGGGSLHNCMSAHGPEAEAFESATHKDLKPEKYDKTLAFMFESCYVLRASKQAREVSFLQKDYLECWQGLKPGLPKSD